MLVAAVVPNFTLVAPAKLLPEIATLVPPEMLPLLGDRLSTIGAGFVLSVIP
jgi:hypothetical protein